MVKDLNKNEADIKAPKGSQLGVRHLQTLFLFLNVVVTMVGRLNASVSIVAMTNAKTTNLNFPEYSWHAKEKSYILSSFYWGYVLTQFPGGYLCRRFGVKRMLFISTLGSGLLSLAIPFSISKGGWLAYCGIRAVQGLFQGVIFPCIHEHLAKWAPFNERNRLGALTHAGVEFGTVLAMGTTGIIAASSIGWPGVSYVAAILCFAWCGLWLIFAANNPSTSKFILNAEREYIESSLQSTVGYNKKIPVPWRAIFTSVPFYAVVIVRAAKLYGSTTILFEIPSYMNGVLNLDIKKNSLFSALPYLVMWFLSYGFLILADVIMKRKWMSLTALRKSFNSIAMWIPAVGLIGLGFLKENQGTLAIVLLIINVGVNSGATIGSALNTIDLSPNHAGILMGIVNMVANSMSILTPLIAGVVVDDTSNRSQWQIVFLIAALVSFLGNLIFVIWGSAKEQPWNAEDFLKAKDIDKSQITLSSIISK